MTGSGSRTARLTRPVASAGVDGHPRSSPAVALQTPPLRPTSSPRTHTRGSRSISSARASRTAWTRVRSAIRVDVARQGAGVGIGGSLGQGGRGIYLLLERGVDPPVLG